MGIGTTQVIIILLVVLILFGGKKIPELAQGLGKGIKNFKDAVREGEEETTIKPTEKIENQNTTQTTQQTSEKKDINA